MKIRQAEIRVRYQETDNMGVVYYANYFVWLEVARTEYLRDAGVPYSGLESRGSYLMVAEACCKYISPARYDDIVRIETWVPALKNSSLEFAHKLYVAERLIATGRSVHVFVNKSGKPVRIPEEIRSIDRSVA